MTPLPTYDRRHATPVAPVERPLPSPSIVRNRKRPIARTVALIVVAALIGGALVFAWDRTGSRDRSGALAVAVTQRDAAQDQVAVLTDRLGDLRGRLTEASDRATALEGRVSAGEAELVSMVGPALPDGKHFGALIALGADQEPPRLVIDIEQWFTDQAAIAAAVEDGVIEPGDIIPNGYYIRNSNPRWRTIEIDPAATVSLTVYPHGQIDNPQIVSLERFADLSLGWSEHWITMEDGKVVAIEQQYIP